MRFLNFTLRYLLLWCLMIQKSQCSDTKAAAMQISYTAYVNITYKDPLTGGHVSEIEESGRYGSTSRIDGEKGWVVLVKTENNKSDGCAPLVNVPGGRWIALVERGECPFHNKITNAAVNKNASAVVIYNNKEQDELISMDHKVHDVVSIFLSKSDGLHVRDLLENGTRVWMEIKVGQQEPTGYPHPINKTSVLFVSISFIVLMIISLAWLVFYYIQRFRYAHAKERMSKRLMHAAKKAIIKMPMRTVRTGDKETDPDCDPCAVCIENYRGGDVIRILPCKHIFHKSCVDPWLLDQRTCPMCKLDILKAFGMQVHPSKESLLNIDLDGASTSVGPSELLHSAMRDDAHVVELVYYPYNVHLRPRLPESRSEAEETITGLEPAIASGPSTLHTSDAEETEGHSNESEALIKPTRLQESGSSETSRDKAVHFPSNNQITVTCVIENTDNTDKSQLTDSRDGTNRCDAPRKNSSSSGSFETCSEKDIVLDVASPSSDCYMADKNAANGGGGEIAVSRLKADDDS